MKEQHLGWCPVATSSTKRHHKQVPSHSYTKTTPVSSSGTYSQPSSVAQRQPLNPGIPDSHKAMLGLFHTHHHKQLHSLQSCSTSSIPTSRQVASTLHPNPPAPYTSQSQIRTAQQLQIKFPLQFSPGPMKPHTENWQRPQPRFYAGENTCLEVQLAAISLKNTAIISHFHLLTRSGNINRQFAGEKVKNGSSYMQNTVFHLEHTLSRESLRSLAHLQKTPFKPSSTLACSEMIKVWASADTLKTIISHENPTSCKATDRIDPTFWKAS